MTCAEVELCGISDSYKSELPDGRFLGRANVARKIKTWSLPQMASGKEAGLDALAYAFSWTATRLREMAFLGRRTGKGWEEDDRARARRWTDLGAKFLRPNPLLCKAAGEDEEFRECQRSVSRGQVTDWKDLRIMGKLG